MTAYLRAAGYAASRISSALKGSIEQFGWLQAEATKWKSEFGWSVRVRSYNSQEEPKEKLYAEVEEI